MFHGVNAVYKIAPFIPGSGDFTPDTTMDDRDIQDLKDWGINQVRLGVMWEAVEAAPGQYNDTYLDEVETLINKMGDAGIYSLVDAHQDVLARVICGEGMPNFYAKQVLQYEDKFCFGKYTDWFLWPIYKLTGLCSSMDNLNLRKDSEGNPLIEDCQKYNFGGFYNSPEAQTLFRAIYDNKGGLQDKFVNFWVHVAKRFANNKYVMGFDPLNEPTVSMDNLFNAVDHLSKGEMDKTVLQPLFARLHKEAYQAANPNSIMVFEPVVFPDVVAIKVLGV